MKNEAYKDMASLGTRITDLNRNQYDRMVQEVSPPSAWVKNCVMAFLFGGGICTLGQGFFLLYNTLLGVEEKDARGMVSVTLIFITAVLTALKVFDNIAKIAGAGTIVPITGFANSMVSPAMEFKSEGMILGLGAKLFAIAGPVLVYGITASIIYGMILFIIGLFV